MEEQNYPGAARFDRTPVIEHSGMWEIDHIRLPVFTNTAGGWLQTIIMMYLVETVRKIYEQFELVT